MDKKETRKILKPKKHDTITPDIARAAISAIRKFKKKKAVDYPQEGELFDRLVSLIYEYEGDISTVSAIGILELVKDKIKGE